MNGFERKFEVVTAYRNKSINLPSRKTKFSAGYDVEAAENAIIPPGEIRLIPTGLKAKCWDDDVLLLYARSSIAVKRYLNLAGGVMVIDSDYYNNPDNEGHFYVPLYNFGLETQCVLKGERIAQAMFSTYYVTTEEVTPLEERISGFGHTGT